MDRVSKFGMGASALALAFSAGAFMFAAPPAVAQDGASSSDTIVVTATRRAEDVQDVPIAVTALTERQIEDIAPRTLEDLDGLAPNVFIGMNTAGPGASAIFIRGLGYADIEKTQNPSVGVIVDGVFLGTSTGQLIDAFDMRQVEVNRGPQGIFFGKNTTAGVIAVSRSLPTREFGFRGSASYGSDNEQIYRGIFNMPLGENAGLKLGGTYRTRDGYYDNLFTGSDYGDREYAGANAAIDWDVTPWLNVLGIVDIIRSEGGGSPVQFGNRLTASILSGGAPELAFPGYNPQTGSPDGLAPHQVRNNFEDADEYDQDMISVTFTADTPLGELVAQTAYMDSTDIVFQDFDGTCAGEVGCPATSFNPLLAATGSTLHTLRDQEYQQLTQEIRLAGSVGPVDYLVGGYYYQHEIGLSQTTNGAVLQTSGEDNESVSIFGNLDWNITDRLTVSGGFRWIDETKDFVTQYDLIGLFPIIPQIRDDNEWDDTITRFAVSWQATDSTLVYFSRSEGFRSGGFSIRGTLSEQIETQNNCGTPGGCPGNNFLSYDPETVTAYELGLKNSFLDGNLIFNTAIFKTEIEDYQSNSVVVTPGYGPGTNTYINNLPEVEIEGIEFELTVKPVFMWSGFEGLLLSATVGLQDGEIVDGTFDGRRTGLGPGGTAGAPGSIGDASGNPLGRLADYNVALRAAYERDIGPGSLQLSASHTIIDDFVLGNFGTTPDIEPEYGLTDASIAYEWNNYRLSLTGKNIGDVEYRNHSLPTVFFQGWGDPATWAVELQARF